MSSVPNINTSPSPIYQPPPPPPPLPPQAPRGLSDSPGLHPLSIPSKEISRNYALLTSPGTQPLPHSLTSPVHNPPFQPLVSPIGQPGLAPNYSPLAFPSFPDPVLQNELNEVKHLLKCSLQSKKVLETSLETSKQKHRLAEKNSLSLQKKVAQLQDQTHALNKDLVMVTKQKKTLEQSINKMKMKLKKVESLEDEKREELQRQKKLNQELLSQLLSAQSKSKDLEKQYSRVLLRLNRCENEYKILITKRKKEHTQEVKDLSKELLSLESRYDRALIKKEKQWLDERDTMQTQIQFLQQQLSMVQNMKQEVGSKRVDLEKIEHGKEDRRKKRTRCALPRKCKN